MTALPRAAALGATAWSRRPPMAVCASLLILGLVVVWMVAPGAFTSGSGTSIGLDDIAAPPSSAHPFGTDDLGRDVLDRVIHGTRSAVMGPVLVALGAALLGGAIGTLAGYVGGRTEGVIMRMVDGLYAFPGLVVAVVLAGVTRGGYWMAVGLLIVLFSPFDARLARAAVLEQRHRPYVEAARLLKLGHVRIVVHHLVPNVVPLVVANMFVAFGIAMVALSSLSFLGIGISPGASDWGRTLAETRNLIETNPLAPLAPAFMLALTAGAANIFGEWAVGRRADRERMT